MISLADRLKVALDRNPALTQAGLARATGATTASVSNWFTGKTLSLKAANVRLAAQYLGCSTTWLETGLGAPRLDRDPRERGTVNYYSSSGTEPAIPADSPITSYSSAGHRHAGKGRVQHV
jgi:transcriptional regulator with XRE-family HTH domain